MHVEFKRDIFIPLCLISCNFHRWLKMGPEELHPSVFGKIEIFVKILTRTLPRSMQDPIIKNQGRIMPENGTSKIYVWSMQDLHMVEPWYTQDPDIIKLWYTQDPDMIKLWCTQDPYKYQYARFLHG